MLPKTHGRKRISRRCVVVRIFAWPFSCADSAFLCFNPAALDKASQETGRSTCLTGELHEVNSADLISDVRQAGVLTAQLHHALREGAARPSGTAGLGAVGPKHESCDRRLCGEPRAGRRTCLRPLLLRLRRQRLIHCGVRCGCGEGLVRPPPAASGHGAPHWGRAAGASARVICQPCNSC